MTAERGREPDFGSEIQLDAWNLRGIAHPVRVRMLGLLRVEGPATATSLARRLGLNSGATSYHLRQLAAHGFVVEDTGRGSARERWWRTAHSNTRLDRTLLAREEGGLGSVFMRSLAELAADNMTRAVDEMATLPEDWRGAGTFNDHVLQLTADELRRLVVEVTEVVARYRIADVEADPEVPAGTAQVVFQFQAFPRPGALERPGTLEPGLGEGPADP